MLTINPLQMAALSDARRRDFEKKLADHLAASDGDTPTGISKMVTTALGQGLTRECDVAQYVGHAMRAGKPSQTLTPDGRVFGKEEVGQTTFSCPVKEHDTKLHWIEIELVGEDDNPIPGEKFRISLPDGTIVTGVLDAAGMARVESIAEPGACQITFPALDREAWEPIGAG